MCAEHSILELVETADRVAIAAPVRTSDRSRLPAASCTGARQLWPVRLSPTRPQELIDFEELLSELIPMARMLRPHLGSRLVSALLTHGVRRRALSSEERCGRRLLTQ